MKKAIFYGRVSTSKQAEEQLPIDSQVDGGHGTAEKLGAKILKVFVDAGISGTTDRRPAFQDAILFCELNGVDYFITWSSSRFARNKRDAAIYKMQLKKMGVKLVYVSMDLDLESNEGWLLDSQMEIMDEFYSRQTSIDTRRSMAKVARDGFWTGGHTPYGYRAVKVGKRSKLVPNEDEVDTANLLFKLKNGGMGSRQIAHYLNENGYTHRGRPWSKTTVGYLLRSPSFVGKTVFGQKDKATGRRRPLDECIVVDSHEPIIDLQLWNAVQQQLDKDKENTDNSTAKSHFVFTGLLKCGKCASSFRSYSASGRSRRYHYYNCAGAVEHKKHASNRLPSHEFDAWLLDEIMGKVITEDTIAELIDELKAEAGAWGDDRAKQRQKLTAKIVRVEQKVNRLYELLESYTAKELNLSDLAPRLRTHRAELVRLEQQLVELDSLEQPVFDFSAIDVPAVKGLIVSQLEDGGVRRVRTFLKSFISRVDVREDEIRIQYNASSLVSGGNAPVGGSCHARLGEPIYRKTNHSFGLIKIVSIELPARFKRAA